MVMDASLYAGCIMIFFPSVDSFTNLDTLNKMICNFCKLTMLVWNGFNKKSICNGGLPSLGQNLDCFFVKVKIRHVVERAKVKTSYMQGMQSITHHLKVLIFVWMCVSGVLQGLEIQPALPVLSAHRGHTRISEPQAG